MSSTSRSASLITSSFRKQRRPQPYICLSCRQVQSRVAAQCQPRRTYASTATATAAVETPTTSQILPTSSQTSTAPQEQPSATVLAGVVLSRPPVITRDPHPFETAYYLYQRRLNERLVLPFTQYFYYKRGTPSFEHWRTKRRERNGTAARDIGNYNPYQKDGWNDEVLVGDIVGEPKEVVKKLLGDEGKDVAESIDAETAAKGELGGLRRRTDADEKNDQKSLERALDRTLYLVVKKPNLETESQWEFPSGPVEGVEGLKECAMRVLDSSCGVNMNTWFVGNHPVGHLVSQPPSARKPKFSSSSTTASSDRPISDKTNETENQKQPEVKASLTAVGSKTFFMKARIMAGQANVAREPSSPSAFDVEDFRWLSKNEIEKVFRKEYWLRVKNMLVEQ